MPISVLKEIHQHIWPSCWRHHYPSIDNSFIDFFSIPEMMLVKENIMVFKIVRFDIHALVN